MALTGDNQKWLGKFLGPITRCINTIKCCIEDLLGNSNDQTATLEAILEAIQNIEFILPEGTVFPTKDVLCDADCQSVLCFTTFNPDGTVANIQHVLPDGTEYTGDVNALDPTCAQCNPVPDCTILPGNSPNCCSGNQDISIAAGNQCIK